MLSLRQASLQTATVLPPPPGVRPNFVDPPSYETAIIALESVFLTLTLVAVGVRIFVRSQVTKIWGWDDYTCIIATMGALAHMIDYTQMFKVGFGRHMWDIPLVTFLKADNTRVLSSNGIVYPVSIGFAKMSILLLYLRIFKINRSLRLAIYAGIAFTALYYTAVAGVAIRSIVHCNGITRIADPFCKNYAKPVTIMNAVVNVVTDFYILVLPIPCIVKLQLSTRYRIGLLVVFGSGLVTCAVSLARMINFAIYYNDSDILWLQGRNAQFTIVEINIAIIVSCASCFPPFFTRTKVASSPVLRTLRSRLLSTTNRGGSSPGASSNQRDPSTSMERKHTLISSASWRSQ